MATQTLAEIARQMVQPPGGILAADESPSTMGKRLETIGLPNNLQNRLAWRMIMATANLRPAVNAIILPEEMLDQEELIAALREQGVIIGVKIDGGLEPFADSEVEEVTKGADDPALRERLEGYFARGAQFTKFRSLIHIDPARGFPSVDCLAANVRAQVKFARASQDVGLVPMVEPEVDMVGAHLLGECWMVTENLLRLTFDRLRAGGVICSRMILKPNMVVSGKNSANRAGPQEVAKATLNMLRRVVPVSVPGVAFLSGGQTDAEAYANLDAIVKLGEWQVPFELTYSFGRAAQDTARKVWRGEAANIKEAQQAFEEQLEKMSQARLGTLIPAEEPAPV